MMKKRFFRKLIIRLTIFVFMTLGLVGCKKASSYYKDANKNYKAGQYEEAAIQYEKAIELVKDRAEYYIDYGMCLIQLGNYTEAIEQFDKAILEKDNSIVRQNNKAALRGKGIAYYLNGKYKKAVNCFEKALDNPSKIEYNIDIMSYKGSAKEKLGEYEEALSIYNDILSKDKDNTAILQSRANIQYLLQNYEESLKDYDTLLEKNKKDISLYLGKYQVLMAQGKDADGETLLNEALNIASSDTPEQKFQKAKIYYFLGDYDTAMTELTSAGEAGYTESYQYLGNIYLEKNDITNAIYYFELYLEKTNNKNISQVYNQIAYCYIKEENYEEALSYINKGLKNATAENEQELRKNEIIAYEKMGDVELALEKMESYITDYPDDQEAARDYIFLQTRTGSSDETVDNSSDVEGQEE